MLAVCLWTILSLPTVAPEDNAPWWDARVAASLDRVPARKAAWEKVLRATPAEYRIGLAYLVADLPLRDLESLPPGKLLDNVELACKARGAVPWGATLPEDVFLDAVLPHVSLTETRDPLRAEFHARYASMARGCKTPGEAACRINQTLFKDYPVQYNTHRLRTDQNARESIAQGMATCTGLSIMLVEACRAVGIPARVAGIASWPGRGGNHTWVEIWDGRWHCVGAAEPDPAGLDHAWFVGEAARAIKNSPQNAIWAVTYKSTGAFFPMVWNEQGRVNAENVTDRYKAGLAPADPSKVPRLMVEVRQRDERVVADVKALDRLTGKVRLTGESLGPHADVNLHLSTPVTPGESLLVVARKGDRSACYGVTVTRDTVVHIDLDHADPAPLAGLLADRFGADTTKQAAARGLLAEVGCDDKARALAWEAYRSSPAHEPLRQQFEKKMVKTKDRTSPYLWRLVGKQPTDGWALVIAMHGGGNMPAQVNDEQWKRMFERYYKDHPEAGGYVYLALRAPNDTWNGFYDDSIGPLMERLILQFVLFGGVNPDKVYALGASHGGYGAFVIGPKLADRFAAVHASAAAPTDGETFGENLRNTRFTFMVGEKDTDYGRAERCLKFEERVCAWRLLYGGYPGGLEWRTGVGHFVPDHDKVGEMLQSGSRNAWPKSIVWVESDDVIRHHFWVESPHPKAGARVEAVVSGNTVKLKAEKLDEIALWLDGPIVDLSKPVTVEVAGGKTLTVTPRPTVETYCQGLEARGEPKLAAPMRVSVPVGR